MTSTNGDKFPRQPDKPLHPPDRDDVDLIEETVAQITDADIDKHLRNVLDRAGYGRARQPGTERPLQLSARAAGARLPHPGSRNIGTAVSAENDLG
jgi:hypothetical protein